MTIERLTMEQRNAICIGEMMATILARISMMNASEVDDIIKVFDNYMPSAEEKSEYLAFDNFREALVITRDAA